MQYINPYELLSVENNLPQVKSKDKEIGKSLLAREIVEKYIANGITDLKAILQECAKEAGFKDAVELPIGHKHLIERAFRNYNQNKAAGISNTIIAVAQSKIKITDCDPKIISAIIRKQKAALFREIDLNKEDNGIGFVEFRGMQLTKADCIKPIDDLDDEDKKDFHLFIYQNKMLNDFLTDGDLTFFNNYKVESIYKLPAFIDLISPFFAEQYNRKLGEYFEKWNKQELSKILSIGPVVNSEFIDGCYSNVHLFLRSLENDIKKQQEEVEENNDVINSISFSVNPSLINLLPSLHFQNIRNKIGGSIKSLAVVINNIGIDKPEEEKIKWFKVSFHLIAIAKEIDCTGLDETRIRDNYFILKNNFDSSQERIEEEKRKNEIKISTQTSATSGNFQRMVNIWSPEVNVKELERQKILKQFKSKYSSDGKKFKFSFPLVIIALVFILVIYNIFWSNDSNDSHYVATNNNYSTPSTNTDSTTISTVNPSSNNNYSNSNNDYNAEPVYVKQSIMTGNFPICSGIKPQYNYNLKTRIIISAQSSDIALKLINQKTNRCIRFVFINEGATYTVKNIPEGIYYLKIAYGNDWVVKEGDPTCKGHFTSNVAYKKDNDAYNFYIQTSDDGSTSTPYYKLRLYTVYTTGTDYTNTQNSISEDDFNN